MGKDKGLEKFLKEAEVLFDGNTYKLNGYVTTNS